MATITASLPNPNGRNLLADPYLSSTTMTTNGGTANDTRPSSGGPAGGSFFRREWITSNTTSPVQMNLSGSGTSATPFPAGQTLTVSAYIRATQSLPQFRIDVQWYNASGANLGSVNGFTVAPAPNWSRHSQSYAAPSDAMYVQTRLIWTGVYNVEGQEFDLANAQAELGPLTEFTDNRPVIRPVLVLGYEYQNASRNVVLELLGSPYPTVFLRPAASQSGTLSLLFSSAADAREARAILTAADRFAFEEAEVGEAFEFITSGPVIVRKVPGVNYWTVDAEYREVEALTL